jgi:hypothetical protein
MIRALSRIVLLVCLGISLFGAGSCHAGTEEWKAEFEAVCSKTDSLMDMSEDELSALLERCDKLMIGMEGENETVRKVNGRRLKNCRDLIRFMLDSKQASQNTGD